MRVSLDLLKTILAKWNADRAPRLAAALSYYTLFSMAPLLVIAIAIGGLVFGEEAARGRILSELRGTVGEAPAALMQSMVMSARNSSDGLLASSLAVVVLFFGAAGVFGELKGALNIVWGVKEQSDQGLVAMVRDRVVSLALVIGSGVLLLGSLLLGAVLSAMNSLLGDGFPLAQPLSFATDFALTVLIVTVLFTVIYKTLPDIQIAWHPVLLGAFVTALLFAGGKIAIGVYLSHSGTASSYGAGGAVVAILLWVYFSAQLLLFGAEFTAVYADRHGKPVTTNERSTPVVAGAERLADPDATAAAGQPVGALTDITPTTDPAVPLELRRDVQPPTVTVQAVGTNAGLAGAVAVVCFALGWRIGRYRGRRRIKHNEAEG